MPEDLRMFVPTSTNTSSYNSHSYTMIYSDGTCGPEEYKQQELFSETENAMEGKILSFAYFKKLMSDLPKKDQKLLLKENPHFAIYYKECIECGKYEEACVELKNHFHVCMSCASEKYKYCYRCQSYDLISNFSNDFSDLCDECYESYTMYCDCGYRIFSEDEISVEGSSVSYCENCIDEHAWECPNCETYYFYGQHCGCGYTEEHDFDYPEECDCSVCNSRRLINAYSYKPRANFLHLPKEKRESIYFGMELEVDESNLSAELAKELTDKSQPDHIYLKRDGSLNKGFEIVTHPMSFKYFMKKFHLNKLTKSCRAHKFRSHATETCGLHIHVSRRALGSSYKENMKTTIKLLIIISNIKEYLIRFSRRSSVQMDRYSKVHSVKNLKEVFILMKSGTRATVLNLRNKSTIEFRIFRGTLNVGTIKASVQFCNEIIKYAKKIDLITATQTTWFSFVENIDKKDNKEFMKYIEKRGICLKSKKKPIKANSSRNKGEL